MELKEELVKLKEKVLDKEVELQAFKSQLNKKEYIFRNG